VLCALSPSVARKAISTLSRRVLCLRSLNRVTYVRRCANSRCCIYWLFYTMTVVLVIMTIWLSVQEEQSTYYSACSGGGHSCNWSWICNVMEALVGRGNITPTRSWPRPRWGEWSASRLGRALPPVPIGQEAGWAPEVVWTQRLEEKSFASAGDRTPVVQYVVRHCTDWAVQSSPLFKEL
jgi:hypothetical protein